jgi:hypothetical protein
MSEVSRGRMTVLDDVLLVGSAAFGIALFELAHRALIRGCVWLLYRGLPDAHQWSTSDAVFRCNDTASLLIPVAAPSTVL